MMKRKPLFPQLGGLLHGADYNPEQWRHVPEIWDEDLRLMRLAKCNVMAVGMFSWSSLEPTEGEFRFDWLDETVDRLHRSGIYTIMGTPSGARPAWLAKKYPEVLRVRPERVRNLFGMRHNHCFTSPAYREKLRIVNTKLAERYGGHPGLLLWHISNEYSGECHCGLCQTAFRHWLRDKYGHDLQRLNEAWYTTFWSHTYADWDEIESPSPIGESKLHGLQLDWNRFVTDQSISFMKEEIAPFGRIAPHIPVTTNFMGECNIDYARMAEHIDLVSWDSYPRWHERRPDWQTACATAFVHDRMRSFKPDRPFLLMESTPSMTNWQETAKLKRPGMHLLSSIQAIAHGSDSVQYFQWRKSRGSSEKLHGAVVDHGGGENTRVFRDVVDTGGWLERLEKVAGTVVPAETALIYDQEIGWAVEGADGPRKPNLSYAREVQRHYEPFWRRGIPVDVVASDRSLDGYKLAVAPMLYMLKPGSAERLEQFVRGGGTLVLTYWSGIADDNDLCFLGGFPGPLRALAGIWAEEIDALYPEDGNVLVMQRKEDGMEDAYPVSLLCELVHAETAEVLAEYGADFYKGRPALTVNRVGAGKVYYLAARADESFLRDFYAKVAAESSVAPALQANWPEGISASVRTDGARDYIFLQNFTDCERQVWILEPVRDTEGAEIKSPLVVPAFGFRLLERETKNC